MDQKNKLRDWFIIRRILIQNKISLIILNKALTFYRNQSKKMINALSNEAFWASGIESEEKLLNQCQKVIEKRLAKVRR